MSIHSRCEPSQPAAARGSYREVWILAYPVVFSMLAQTVMGLVDTLFMGWVSTTAQGAVGLGSIVTWSFASLFIGTLSVVNTFVAQHYGAGAHRRCGEVAWHGMAVAAVFSLLVVASVPLLRRVVELFGAPAEVTRITIAYATIRVLGAVPLRCFEMTITSFMRGIGDTRTPMKVALATVALNVPLNYWLVFGGLGVPALGAEGAAYATVASTAIGVAVLAGLFLRRRLRERYGTGWPGRLKVAQLRALLRVGLPIGVGWVLEMVTWTFFSAAVARFGEAQLAAHNIVLQVLHLSFMPGVAISVAAQTLVGQALGARDPEDAGRRAYAAIKLGIGFMALMGFVFLVGGGLIASLLSRDPQVIRIARVLFILAAAFQVFDAMGMISSGILRGAGDTRRPTIAAVGFAWFVFVPLIWIFGFVLEWGVKGSWAAATAYITGLGVVLFALVRRGRWKALSVIDGEVGADADVDAVADGAAERRPADIDVGEEVPSASV